jgi:hypothetical protein
MLGAIARIFIQILNATVRCRVEDPGGLLAGKVTQPGIVAFWHNRIFLMPRLLRMRPAAVLISASRDGAKLVRIVEGLGVTCVRGSSSRRGRQALRELTRYVRDGYWIGITPDGPRGPRYKVQHGVISLAQLTGAAIHPVSYSVNWKITFNSWDRFIVPLPFARCVLRVGEPVTVPRDADDSQREACRARLEQQLIHLTGED